MSTNASLFLSHSHKDKPFVRKLAADLKTRGVRVWVDEAEMMIGDSLIAKIGDAIGAMDYVAAILSKHSITSPWVTRELDIALNHEIAGRRVKVLPLVVDHCELPPFLIGKVYGDFRDPSRYEATVEELMRRLAASATTPGVQNPQATAPKADVDDKLDELRPFELRLLFRLNRLRLTGGDFSAEGSAQKFLNDLAELGDFILSARSSILLYKSAIPFMAAYNAMAKEAGQETEPPVDKVKELVTSLMHALDTISVEVGIQALRAAYPGDRERAARLLGEFGPIAEGAVRALRIALKDSSGPVRTAAVWALTAIGTEDANEAVQDYESSKLHPRAKS